MAHRIRLHRLGQRRTDNDIEQSCGVIDVMGKRNVVERRFVIDCGLHPNPSAKAGEKGWIAPDFSLFEDGVPIDAVLFTHAHTDHVGYGPALLPYLAPDAKFWMTKPTAKILMYGYEDGLNIANRRESPAPFTPAQMLELERRIEVIHKPGAGDFLGVRLLVHPAGHINGACSYSFKVNGEIVHFAGDRCEHNQPGVKGAPELPPGWKPTVIAGSDCTYGADPDSDARSWEAEMSRGYDIVAETLRKGSIALVHGFGIHRGGAVSHELKRRGIRNPGDIVLDGACRYYAKEQGMPEGQWSKLDSALDLRGVLFVDGRLRDMVARRKKAAIVTTSGMGGPGGPSTFWRRNVLEDPNAAMIFTGFVAPDTDGDKILIAAAKRQSTGKPVTVTFTVEDLRTRGAEVLGRGDPSRFPRLARDDGGLVPPDEPAHRDPLARLDPGPHVPQGRASVPHPERHTVG